MQELQDLIVYALYVWIAASVVWLVSSLMRGRRAGEVEHSESGDQAESLSGNQDQSSDADEALDLRVDGAIEAGTTQSSGTEPALATASSASASASAGLVDSTPVGPSATNPDDSDTAPADTAPPQAASADTFVDDSETLNTEPTLAALLSGIRLPHDLLPVLAQGADPSDQSVTLISNTAPPEVIGGAIADELERLGFGIKSVATDRALATREDSVISLRIAPEAGTLRNDDGLLYPDSAPDAVIVQLDLEQQA